jgi:hypothetical protein
VQNWYLSVQREIGPRMLVDVAYVGNHADSLLLFVNINQAAPNNAAGTLSLQARRPIPSFADITYPFDGGKSEYRALQLKYEWRMKADVSLLNAVTWSRAMDNGAASLETRTEISLRPRISTTSARSGARPATTSRTTTPRALCGACRLDAGT